MLIIETGQRFVMFVKRSAFVVVWKARRLILTLQLDYKLSLQWHPGSRVIGLTRKFVRTNASPNHRSENNFSGLLVSLLSFVLQVAIEIARIADYLIGFLAKRIHRLGRNASSPYGARGRVAMTKVEREHANWQPGQFEPRSLTAGTRSFFVRSNLKKLATAAFFPFPAVGKLGNNVIQPRSVRQQFRGIR